MCIKLHIENTFQFPSLQTLMNVRHLPVRASVRTQMVASPVAAMLALSWSPTSSPAEVKTSPFTMLFNDQIIVRSKSRYFSEMDENANVIL